MPRDTQSAPVINQFVRMKEGWVSTRYIVRIHAKDNVVVAVMHDGFEMVSGVFDSHPEAVDAAAQLALIASR